MEMIKAEGQKEKGLKKSRQSVIDLWDTIRGTNIHITGVLEGEERERGTKRIVEEIMTS